MSLIEKGCLYIVATPIGNLEDITRRAETVLSSVDAIAAEDTRHSSKLLQHLGIDTSMFALHEHNETQISDKVVQRLQQGDAIALISDAGTPLISDPGYQLVKKAREAKIKIVPVPGASSILAALSCSGLPTDRFVFEGFLPSKSAGRKKRLKNLEHETRTMIFFESPHRLLDSLNDIGKVFGKERQAVLARELTKTWETFFSGTIAQLLAHAEADSNQCKGEIVVMLSGTQKKQSLDEDALRLLELLLQEFPLKRAASLAAKYTGLNKSLLYQVGLEQKKK